MSELDGRGPGKKTRFSGKRISEGFEIDTIDMRIAQLVGQRHKARQEVNQLKELLGIAECYFKDLEHHPNHAETILDCWRSDKKRWENKYKKGKK